MTDDEDNAGEVVVATVRVALTAAGQLAEQTARRREATLRDAERDSAARLATLQAQLAAERQAARHSARDVLQRGDKAGVAELVQVWEQIRSWDDPVATSDRDQIRGLVKERFGVDPESLLDQRGPAAQTPVRDVPAVAAVLATDIAGQRADAGRREAGSTDDRAADRPADLQDTGAHAEINAGNDVRKEAAQARALAAQSHPTPAALAAQPPAIAPRARPRVGMRRGGVEVQSPGR